MVSKLKKKFKKRASFGLEKAVEKNRRNHRCYDLPITLRAHQINFLGFKWRFLNWRRL